MRPAPGWLDALPRGRLLAEMLALVGRSRPHRRGDRARRALRRSLPSRRRRRPFLAGFPAVSRPRADDPPRHRPAAARAPDGRGRDPARPDPRLRRCRRRRDQPACREPAAGRGAGADRRARAGAGHRAAARHAGRGRRRPDRADRLSHPARDPHRREGAGARPAGAGAAAAGARADRRGRRRGGGCSSPPTAATGRTPCRCCAPRGRDTVVLGSLAFDDADLPARIAWLHGLRVDA